MTDSLVDIVIIAVALAAMLTAGTIFVWRCRRAAVEVAYQRTGSKGQSVTFIFKAGP